MTKWEDAANYSAQVLDRIGGISGMDKIVGLGIQILRKSMVLLMANVKRSFVAW